MRGATGVRADCMSRISFAMASFLLRHCERVFSDSTKIVPSDSNLPFQYFRNCSRCSGLIRAESMGFHFICTFVSVLFTCWPPGPELRQKLNVDSASRSSGRITLIFFAGANHVEFRHFNFEYRLSDEVFHGKKSIHFAYF